MNYMNKMGFGGLRLPMDNGKINLKELNAMVDYYMSEGGTYFDTAHGYCNGQSEIAFRESLVKRYDRQKFELANKLSSAYFNNENEIIPLFHQQLENCGVTYFDYYLMHAQTRVNYVKYKKCKAYEQVYELKQRGFIKNIGISIHDKGDVLENILNDYPWIDVVQIQLNYLDYDSADVESNNLMEICKKYNKPILVMEPLKGGHLVKLPQRARELFTKAGRQGGEAELAYRYVAQFEQVKKVLSGVHSLDEIKQNVKTFKEYKKLTEEDNILIKQVKAIIREVGAIQCTACRYCVDGCPQGLLIPDLFACYNSKKVFNDWNQGYYYATVLTSNGRKASNCIGCGKCEKTCPQHLNIRKLLKEVANEFERSNFKPVQKAVSSRNIVPVLADIHNRLLYVYKYGGNFTEYLEKLKIFDFDFLGEGEGFIYGLQMLYDMHCMPKRAVYYGNISNDAIDYGKKLGVEVVSFNELSKVGNRVIIILSFWNYNLYKRLHDCGYKTISYSELVHFTLYKTIMIDHISDKCKKLNCQNLIVKFPKANEIKNQSPLEKFLSNNSIYSYNKQIHMYGIGENEVKYGMNIHREYKNGYLSLSDETSDDYNVINGYRLTTDIVENAKHNIWIFGSSVALGSYADDSHTIASGLQREINRYYGECNDYNVINASNYYGNEVYNLLPFFDKQPIKPGDICIFIIDAPNSLMDEYKEIVDLSKCFARPHDYGEIFVDINHMTGKGYCVVAQKIFEIMREKNLFSQNAANTVLQLNWSLDMNSIHTEIMPDDDRQELMTFIKKLEQYRRRVGAIVMNCNPFTLGHLYLIEYAAKEVEQLFIFVVQEDSSFFSFDDRMMLVKEGTKHLKNITVLPSGEFMISKKTFAAYSNKSELQNEKIDPSLDVEIFANYIAPSLGITTRFAGEEPLDNVTRQYNETMRRILPEYGIEFRTIKRKMQSDEPISASRVRKLLDEKNFVEIKKIVPDTTYQFLIKNYLSCQKVD